MVHSGTQSASHLDGAYRYNNLKPKLNRVGNLKRWCAVFSSSKSDTEKSVASKTGPTATHNSAAHAVNHLNWPPFEVLLHQTDNCFDDTTIGTNIEVRTKCIPFKIKTSFIFQLKHPSRLVHYPQGDYPQFLLLQDIHWQEQWSHAAALARWWNDYVRIRCLGYPSLYSVKEKPPLTASGRRCITLWWHSEWSLRGSTTALTDRPALETCAVL